MERETTGERERLARPSEGSCACAGVTACMPRGRPGRGGAVLHSFRPACATPRRSEGWPDDDVRPQRSTGKPDRAALIGKTGGGSRAAAPVP